MELAWNHASTPKQLAQFMASNPLFLYKVGNQEIIGLFGLVDTVSIRETLANDRIKNLGKVVIIKEILENPEQEMEQEIEQHEHEHEHEQEQHDDEREIDQEQRDVFSFARFII
jgi:hypothetical protein